MTIKIKYMVSPNCEMALQNIFDNLELPYNKIQLGLVDLDKPITPAKKEALIDSLFKAGFASAEDNKKILIGKIKNCIIKMIQNDASICSLKMSHYLSRDLHYNYTYLANLFSEETGTCLRNFVIAHKIEKAKEMLIYEGCSVKEIAWKLNYSSIAHLSSQFTRITGFSPREFKKHHRHSVTRLDQITMLEAV